MVYFSPVFSGKPKRYNIVRKESIVGKGDIKTKKGKIFRGTYGKVRPKKVKKIEKAK